jgi:hypothetical protein
VAFTGLVIALGSECCAVSPADPRFNHDFVDEALADLLSLDEKCHVSVHQVSSTIEGDLLIVTIVDATGPGAVSSNVLSQTLMLQALNPDSPLRQRCLGTPLRVVPPGSVVQFEQETKLSERDSAVMTAGSKLLQGQQLLVDNIGKSKDEVKALAEKAAEAKKKLASAQEEAAQAEAALAQAASGDKHADRAPRQQRGFISGGEIKALESVFDMHFDPERRSYNMDEARTQSKFVLEESQLRLKELEIESKLVFEESQLRLKELKSLEDLRTLTLRQTDERNAMIAKLEEDLVHIFVLRFHATFTRIIPANLRHPNFEQQQNSRRNSSAMHDRLADYRHDRHHTLERGANESSNIQDWLSRAKSLQPSDHSQQSQQRLSRSATTYATQTIQESVQVMVPQTQTVNTIQHLHKVVEDARTPTNPVVVSGPCLGPSRTTSKTASLQLPFRNEWMETNTRRKWNSFDK